MVAVGLGWQISVASGRQGADGETGWRAIISIKYRNDPGCTLNLNVPENLRLLFVLRSIRTLGGDALRKEDRQERD